MKDMQQLISRFDEVSNTTIPEEMIGAYIEGNLLGAELRMVQNMFHDDAILNNYVNEMSNEFLPDVSINAWDTNAELEGNVPEICSMVEFGTETLFNETEDYMEFAEQDFPDLPILTDDLSYDCDNEHIREIPSIDNFNELPSLDDFTATT